MMQLIHAPRGKSLRIVDVAGGESVRRRLFSLGFHNGDEIELTGQGILRGPLLIKNIQSDVTVALGRGIAQKIFVEVSDGSE
jgi:ferrous iron transport protein A